MRWESTEVLQEEEQLNTLALADDREVVRLGEGGLVTVDLDTLHLYVVAAHGCVRCRQHVSEVTLVDESCTEAKSESEVKCAVWCAHPRFSHACEQAPACVSLHSAYEAGARADASEAACAHGINRMWPIAVVRS